MLARSIFILLTLLAVSSCEDDRERARREAEEALQLSMKGELSRPEKKKPQRSDNKTPPKQPMPMGVNRGLV